MAPRAILVFLPRAFALLAAALLVACGGSSDAPAVAPVPASIDAQFDGVAVVKVQASGGRIATLQERLTGLTEAGPDRRVALLEGPSTVAATYSPPAGWRLIDATLHPSGEISAAIATAREVKLVRLDAHGVQVAENEIFDNLAANDRYYDGGGMKDDTSLLPYYTRDAVRIAAIGEELAVGLRTGRNAAVAYRFGYSRASGYVPLWRTLAEPGVSIFPVSLTGGTFDVFGALQNQWPVWIDADASGAVAIAVASSPGFAPVFPAHADYFHETIGASVGVLVTRIAPDGTRIGTTVVDTVRPSELHGLRLQAGEIDLVGRVFSERRTDGTGWNAYVARIDRASGTLLGYRVLDVDRGEILFDAVPLGQGRLLVGGAAGYTQNPDGASIPEAMDPLVAILESDGTLRERIAFPAGPRQNQVRSLALRDGRWIAGGLSNGPGTHSGDSDPSAITARGFVREAPLPD